MGIVRFIPHSVYPTLLTTVPGWDRAVEKMECAHHACKCYRGTLEKAVQEILNTGAREA